VSHTDPMILALRALGETAGTGHDDEHELTCAHCRTELVRLSEVVDLARTGPAEQLESPPPQVWDRISAAVGLDPSVTNGTATVPAAVNGPAAPAPPPAIESSQRTGMNWRRGRLTATVAGLAAGLIIGIGGTAGIVQLTKAPATRVVAQIELSPLPAFPQWNGVTGTAVMRATASQRVMVVTLNAPAKPGFYEVWLLARNGVSMISLGDLSADHDGTFTVPPGVDLRNYSRIDISLQPFDGSTLHVKTSVVRGSLPAVALGDGAAPT
jgi:Anti-sigma-K factor rskA